MSKIVCFSLDSQDHSAQFNRSLTIEKISRDLEKIKQKKETLERELPNLVKNSNFMQENITVFEEFNGFRNALLSFQESFSKGDEMLVFSSPKKIQEPYLSFLINYTTERVKKDIHARIIYGQGMKEFASNLHGNKKTQIKFVNIVTPSTIAVGPDRVILMNWSEKPKFIILTGKEVVESYHSFFDSFWKIAK